MSNTEEDINIVLSTYDSLAHSSTMSSVYDYLSPDTTAVAESLCVMLQKESTPYRCCNYPAYSSSVKESDRVSLFRHCVV